MRRLIDIALASSVLLFLSPAFALISLLIALDSPGSPFYGGWRAGKDGARFRMWKFRTMVQDADRRGGAITTRCDPRITRVGNFLRKSKLDELPQFFNLLTGDLTLVGPRPEDPSIAEQYSSDQKQVLAVKPGITGPTQLHFTTIEAEAIPDGADAEQYYLRHILDPKVRFDLDYLRRRTFTSDLRVVFQTISLMFRAITQSTQS
jgi:lipopolysaccharide/colanic/teichoic acid biosynthesis glycosyltransferase